MLLKILDRDALGTLFLVAGLALLAVRLLCGESGCRWAKWIAGTAVIGYAAHRWHPKPPRSADYLKDLVLRSSVAAALAYAAGRLALSLLIGVYDATLGPMLANAKRRAEEWEREYAERDRDARAQWAKLESERSQQVPPPLPPPVPSAEERAATALKRYENALRFLETANLDQTEHKSAVLKAKQAYLKELDGILK